MSGSPPPSYDVVNLPARTLQAIHPVEALAPQQFGLAKAPRRSAAWSPGGFALLGAGFFATAGLVLGCAVSLVLRERARGA